MKSILTICLLLLPLMGCVSGVKPTDSYTDSHGTTTVFRTDREACVQSCNDDYSRCMESSSSQSAPVNGPAGMFGVSSECRSSLKGCLPSCNGR